MIETCHWLDKKNHQVDERVCWRTHVSPFSATAVFMKVVKEVLNERIKNKAGEEEVNGAGNRNAMKGGGEGNTDFEKWSEFQ